MRFLSAELTDFRNVVSARLEFSPGFTLLVGPNGQGKTNTLEALYLLSALRPLRNVPRKALVRTGTSRATVAVRAEQARTGLTHELALTLEGQQRQLTRDDKRVATQSFLGMVVTVAFTPDDLQLGKGGPDARRRFLDRALLDLRPAYLVPALRYAKAVKDRNRLLAEQGSDATLDAFDRLVAAEGAAITVARAEYVEALGPRVRAHFERIATPAPALGLRYAPSVGEALTAGDVEATASAFLERLHARRALDRRKKTTSLGPHLDDLELTLEGAPTRERASQGQHRALVLALKLAEITHLAERLGEPPVLLLDDMSSELDATRSRQLFEAVRELEGQVILTSTEPPEALAGRLESPHPLAVYEVRAGTLAPRSW
jgi:DNA replication and repair protein RecF